jgi:hypothetical protein
MFYAGVIIVGMVVFIVIGALMPSKPVVEDDLTTEIPIQAQEAPQEVFLPKEEEMLHFQKEEVVIKEEVVVAQEVHQGGDPSAANLNVQ